MLQIVQVSPDSVEAAEGITITMPCVAFMGFDGQRVVGSGGLAWGAGRAWIWLRIEHSNPSYAVPVMRQFRKLIAKAKQLGETAVFTPRDANYSTSKKLLTVLGFSFFAIENGVEIWWRSLLVQPSPALATLDVGDVGICDPEPISQ